MSSYQYRKSHCGDKTVVRSSYLHNGISYTGKMSSLYWIEALVSKLLFPLEPIPPQSTASKVSVNSIESLTHIITTHNCGEQIVPYWLTEKPLLQLLSSQISCCVICYHVQLCRIDIHVMSHTKLSNHYYRIICMNIGELNAEICQLTFSPMVASLVIITTNCGATSDDKASIMKILGG